MKIYFPAFAIFALVLVGMALGVILSNRRIRGSCGGLGNMRDESGQPLCECGAPPGSCGAAVDEEKAKPEQEIVSS